MKLSRDAWLAIGLIMVLLLVTIAAAIQQTRQQILPAYSSLSTRPDGTQALALWLEQLNYSVNRDVSTTFQPPPETGLIFMLEPFPGVTAEEWQTIDGWVEEGGILVLAGDSLGTALAMRRYRFNLSFLSTATGTLTVQTPLLNSPPAQVNTRAVLQTSRNDFVTHLAVGSEPVLVSFEQEAGRVILSAAPYPFSNAGLKEAGNPALVLNIVSAAGQAGTVWFDEWHHGLRSMRTQIVGPGNWLRYTPAGHALLYIAVVIFAALVLWGRHFGRPLPLPRNATRRAPLEYITAIANLSRRAGHRSAVLKQYHHWLKRGLGQRYRLNPTLPDDQYVAQLSRLNPALDGAALRNLLAQLQRKNVTESEMIQLAAQVSTWLKES